MPVSHKYKTIFIHIPKCAGSTIECLLNTDTIEEYFSLNSTLHTGLCIDRNIFTNEEEYKHCVHKRPQHFTYKELHTVLSREICNTYKKFTVVRHPFTRIVSGFHFAMGLQKNGEIWNKINSFKDYVDCLDYSTFVRVSTFFGHFETQTFYLNNSNSNIASDVTIFKYENLNECLDYLKPITNFTVVPHLRKSHINKTWQDYKTPELEEKIYNFYKEDFLNFNYKCDI